MIQQQTMNQSQDHTPPTCVMRMPHLRSVKSGAGFLGFIVSHLTMSLIYALVGRSISDSLLHGNLSLLIMVVIIWCSGIAIGWTIFSHFAGLMYIKHLLKNRLKNHQCRMCGYPTICDENDNSICPECGYQSMKE